MDKEGPPIDGDLMDDINSIPTEESPREEPKFRFATPRKREQEQGEGVLTIGKEYAFHPPVDASGVNQEDGWVHGLQFSSGKYAGFKESHIFEGKADSYFKKDTVFFFRVDMTGGSRIEELGDE